MILIIVLIVLLVLIIVAIVNISRNSKHTNNNDNNSRRACSVESLPRSFCTSAACSSLRCRSSAAVGSREHLSMLRVILAQGPC